MATGDPILETVPGPADEDAALVARFAHRVDLFSRRIGARFGLGSAAEDDLASAGFWGLFQAIRNRRLDAHPRELSAYVSLRIEGAVLDEARRILGRAQRLATVDPSDLDDAPLLESGTLGESRPDSLRDPESTLEIQTRWRRVDESLGALDADQRDLLVAYASGESVAELARSDGSSPGRIQARMTRLARRVRARSPELRRLLRQEL